MNIRKMTRDDISAALAIDMEAFDEMWSEKFFEEELRKDYSHYYIAENNSEAVGYIGIWCIYETAELVRIAVKPNHRRYGVANLLVKQGAECAEECGCERMMLEVRDSNCAARGLYKKNNFAEIGIRKGYYGDEDAIIMEAKF